MVRRLRSPIAAYRPSGAADREGSWRNWTGDQTCTPARLVRPRTVAELGEVVAGAAAAGEEVSVAGAGHSFTDTAATPGTMIDVGALAGVMEADTVSGLVRVGAGTTLAELNVSLDRLGLAMENLGDIDAQTVAGAISTATHGTGARLGNLSSQVAGLEIVLADGSVRRVGGQPGAGGGAGAEPRWQAGGSPGPAAADEDPELLAARVGLGALGAIASVTLRCVPAFTLHRVDEPRRLDRVLEGFDGLTEGSEHFELFVYPHTRRALTIRRNRTGRPARPRGRLRHLASDVILENGIGELAMRAARRRPSLSPRVSRMAARSMSHGEQLDRSHRVFANLRSIRFTEMEYALPRAAGPEALDAVLRLIEGEGFHVPMPIECRVVGADEALLSPSHRRDTTYVAVHQYRGMEWRPYFEAVEEIMRSRDGRPHWGKRHSLTATELERLYPRWGDFQAVRDRFDPGRTFTNRYAARVLGP